MNISKRIGKLALWSAAAASALALTAPALAQTASPNVLTIGVISSRSGAFALQGQNAEQGETLAAEEINARGGILGRQIKLITLDSKSRAEEASRAFRDLAAGGADIIIGNIATGEAQAATALSKELKVPFFATGSYGRFLTEEQGHRYLFRLLVNARAFYGPIAESLSERPYKRWCTISIDFAFGRDLVQNVVGTLKARRPEVEVIPGCEFWIPLGTTEFSSYITAILAKQPDAVLFGGLVGQSGIAFVTQAKAFGLFNKVAAAHTALGWATNNEGLRKEDIPPNLITASDFPYPPVDRPANKAFVEAFKKRWNGLPYSEAASGYATVNFIAAAYAKAKKVDREAFIDAAEGLTVDHPAQGPITVRAFDHQATTGVWVGELSWDETNQRPGLVKTRYVSAEKYLPTAEEVKKLRGAP
jgi:branched-chain amino acid transport system substrate-binding protein